MTLENVLVIRLVMASFSAYRLAQLVTIDEGPFKIFLRLRAAVSPGSSAAALLFCPYCVGVYMAALCALPVLFPSLITDVLLLVFGIAGIQAFLQGKRNG